LKPVGETEFVNGIAAQSASGRYGETRVGAGIVGFADLTLGDGVEEVLQAHINAAPARFRGIRHAAGFDASPEVRNSHTNPPADLYELRNFREGFAKLSKLGLSFDAWNYHPQIRGLTELARAFPDTSIVLDHFGGPLVSVLTRGGARKSSSSGKKTLRNSRDAPTSRQNSAESTCR